MIRAMLIAVALSCFVVGGADARYDTGNNLYGFCKKSELSLLRAMCLGYVTGVTDALENLSAFCIPQGATREQVTDAATLYLRDHPETRHLPASELVTAALKEKFPCN